MEVGPHTETGENKLSITFRLHKVGKCNINVDQKSFVNTGKLTQGKIAKEQNYIHEKIGAYEYLGSSPYFIPEKSVVGLFSNT